MPSAFSHSDAAASARRRSSSAPANASSPSWVTGGGRRSPVTQPVFTALAFAADVTRPEDDDSPSPLVWFAHMIQSLISDTFSTAHLLLAVALRDGQRAEHLADELAAKAAGTDAAAGLSDVSVCMETVAMVVRQSARSGGGAAEMAGGRAAHRHGSGAADAGAAAAIGAG